MGKSEGNPPFVSNFEGVEATNLPSGQSVGEHSPNIAATRETSKKQQSDFERM
jgi:hypothetical protein